MKQNIIITAGSTYLDIDAYACSVAMAELLQLQGIPAIAYSAAPCNYSVCEFLIEKGQILTSLQSQYQAETAKYIVVDVSDPEYMKENVPLSQVVEIYDHHVGFEAYWTSRIGEQAHIEFIGAAATLIYREWKRAGLQDQMTRATALLLIAAILDNTLNLTSSNTTAEDRIAFHELCQKANVDHKWCVTYFSQVQENVEADLKNALFNDIKTLRGNAILPPRIAQLCVWDARGILERLPEIRRWFADKDDSWMINIIDLRQHCSYFVCDDHDYQKGMEKIFHIQFQSGVAKSPVSYLRKEIIKKTLTNL
ncbi:MAG: DHH family protein [Lachnospiraceae bacterium]|nr:DHH family protein [Lachnospiraceae bacterium]